MNLKLQDAIEYNCNFVFKIYVWSSLSQYRIAYTCIYLKYIYREYKVFVIYNWLYIATNDKSLSKLLM